MGIKWISQRSQRVTLRPQYSCIVNNLANCFQYIPIVILLHFTFGILVVVAVETGSISSTWPPSTKPLTPSIGQQIKPDNNTSLEHIYLRDITKRNDGK